MALTLALVCDPVFQARFLQYVKEDEKGCWIWTGAKSRTEYGALYGVFSIGNHRTSAAHRVAYAMFYRIVPPPGEPLDHLCRVPTCVNPWHLEQVTHQENAIRGQLARSVGVAKIHCPAGHPYDERNTYRHGRKRFCRLCGIAAVRRYIERKARLQ